MLNVMTYAEHEIDHAYRTSVPRETSADECAALAHQFALSRVESGRVVWAYVWRDNALSGPAVALAVASTRDSTSHIVDMNAAALAYTQVSHG